MFRQFNLHRSIVYVSFVSCIFLSNRVKFKYDWFWIFLHNFIEFKYDLFWFVLYNEYFFEHLIS